MTRRLCIIALVIAALVGHTLHTHPAIFSSQIVPVQDGELERLNTP